MDYGKQMKQVSNSSFQDGQKLFQRLGRNNGCIVPSPRSKVMVEFSKRKFLELRSYKKQGLTSKISGVGLTKGMWLLLDKISHIHGHLLHGGVVECLNVPQGSLVILSHHVDGYALSAKTTTPTNPDRGQHSQSH